MAHPLQTVLPGAQPGAETRSPGEGESPYGISDSSVGDRGGPGVDRSELGDRGHAGAGGRPGRPGPDLVVADATALPPTLDPFKVYGTQTQSFFRLFLEPLFDRDPDGKIRTPLLERWGPVDRLTWEFRLRPGVRFHDGGELTSADVVYSLGRILDPQVNSPRRVEFAEFDTIVAIDTLHAAHHDEASVSAAPRATVPVQHDPARSAAGAPRRRVLPGADRPGAVPARGAQPEAGRAHRVPGLPRRRAQGPERRLPVHPGGGGAIPPATGRQRRHRHEPAPAAGRLLAPGARACA